MNKRRAKVGDTDICIQRYEEQYSEEKLWVKIAKTAKQAGSPDINKTHVFCL